MRTSVKAKYNARREQSRPASKEKDRRAGPAPPGRCRRRSEFNAEETNFGASPLSSEDSSEITRPGPTHRRHLRAPCAELRSTADKVPPLDAIAIITRREPHHRGECSESIATRLNCARSFFRVWPLRVAGHDSDFDVRLGMRAAVAMVPTFCHRGDFDDVVVRPPRSTSARRLPRRRLAIVTTGRYGWLPVPRRTARTERSHPRSGLALVMRPTCATTFVMVLDFVLCAQN